MWVAKTSFEGDKAFLGGKAIKHEISLVGFPLSYSYQKKYIIVHIAGILIGKEKNKKRFIRDLKQSRRVINFEVNNDFVIATIKESITAKPFYNKNIIHLAPTIIGKQETITIGSFDKKSLVKAISVFEKIHNAKIHYIQQEKIKSISIVKQNPELTNKQKQALHLAIKNGYYNYPRKIDIQTLAKLSKLSFATYHAHLRKAEQKLLPFFFE